MTIIGEMKKMNGYCMLKMMFYAMPFFALDIVNQCRKPRDPELKIIQALLD